MRRVLVVAGLLATLAGCGLFKPDVPEGSGGNIYEKHYETPDSTLASMAIALEAKGDGNAKDVYAGALADTLPTGSDPRAFHAFFDIEVYRQQPAPIVGPDGWDRQHELDFYDRLSAYLPYVYDMTWIKGPGEVDPPLTGTITDAFRRSYVLRAIHTGGNDTIAIGTADLYFVRSGTNWLLFRWDDQADRTPGANPDQHRSFSYRRLN